jgi:uncharacterized Zn finger protein (UPF0148 family)
MAECENCGRPLVEGEDRLCPSCKKPWSEATKTAAEVGELTKEVGSYTKLRVKGFFRKKSDKD